MKNLSVSYATCRAVLTRADGTVVDLGEIAAIGRKSFLSNMLGALRRWLGAAK